jgi:hypothetical protein
MADGEAATLRRLDGELKVRMALVGGRVEQALVSGLTEHAEAEAALVRLQLAALGVSSSVGAPPKKAKHKHKGKHKGEGKGKEGRKDTGNAGDEKKAKDEKRSAG